MLRPLAALAPPRVRATAPAHLDASTLPLLDPNHSWPMARLGRLPLLRRQVLLWRPPVPCFRLAWLRPAPCRCLPHAWCPFPGHRYPYVGVSLDLAPVTSSLEVGHAPHAVVPAPLFSVASLPHDGTLDMLPTINGGTPFPAGVTPSTPLLRSAMVHMPPYRVRVSLLR
jgi:hypothetical protein